jgi:hypothetical protein
MYAGILILLSGNVVWCLLVTLTRTVFALLLFEGICRSNSKNESISLQRATLGAGLQNRTPTTSGARSWYKMSYYSQAFVTILLIKGSNKGRIVVFCLQWSGVRTFWKKLFLNLGLVARVAGWHTGDPGSNLGRDNYLLYFVTGWNPIPLIVTHLLEHSAYSYCLKFQVFFAFRG